MEAGTINPDAKPEYTGNNFPVVVIGTTSGGFEKIRKFSESIPRNSATAYIVITSYNADTDTLYRQLESASLNIPLVKANNELNINPDKLYIIPSMHLASISDHAIHLTAVNDNQTSKMPIDHFMRTAANHIKENSIAVLFGGSGTDGSLGIQNIREAGGAVFAMDPFETEHAEMLMSAISTGCVDYILPAEKIPDQLFAYIHNIPIVKKITPESEDNIDFLQKILQLIKTQTGNDFAHYKKSTVYRRIEKRMSLHVLGSYSEYFRFMQEHPEEVKHLFNDLLISVTNFFRDPEAFDALKKVVLPRLLENKPDNYVMRIWVPGCATGEEVYSIAMILQEYNEETKKSFKFQIFGTDINEESIQKARVGSFLDNIEMDVSRERLQKFFFRSDGLYFIKKEIRESVIFAVQNVTKDAPFTKLDILSCRNLLIYFGAELQERLLPVFHYSLKSDGYMFLGSSESIGKFNDAFRVVDKKWKLFQKIDSYSSNMIFNSNAVFKTDLTKTPGTPDQRKARQTGLADLVYKTLVNNFTPPGVLINERGDILYVHGHTSKFLEMSSGQANLNILNMAKNGLQYDLHTAIHEAIINKREVVKSGIQFKTDANLIYLRIIVKPIDTNETSLKILLVVFEEIPVPKILEENSQGKKRKQLPAKAEELRQELQFTKESLQATIEELQASNEELQSANEELQSTNEELQSTNEEMETSKEELQSVNEELITLNAELQSKIEQLSRAEDDMRNLLNSTNIGTVFLDNKLCIKRFTSEVTKIVYLINTDVGRPIEHIVNNLQDDSLIADIREVNTSLKFLEREVQTKDGLWYLLRIMPYRTVENVVDGVVLTFTDITTFKKDL